MGTGVGAGVETGVEVAAGVGVSAGTGLCVSCGLITTTLLPLSSGGRVSLLAGSFLSVPVSQEQTTATISRKTMMKSTAFTLPLFIALSILSYKLP